MSGITGLIGAMDEEIKLLLESMRDKVSTVKAGVTYYSGTIFGQKAVLCKSGVGKVNAAVTTQVLLDVFGVTRVLFTGVAGALHPDLEIGDIVVSSLCIQHDMDVGALGYPRGVIPYQEVSSFPAEPELIQLAEEACLALRQKSVTGIVLSGDQFIASAAVVAELREQLHGACAEMEGAAVAQVCFMNEIPFVIIRSMSDKADGSAHVNYREFTVAASERSHAILEYMLKAM
ncbi:5'-methylthioadenosine/adenosylhomocysteine nucleosidase [Paenibacillus sp. S150]|uniref:5'-methylthioadenosine/adenosylhomocysteine nucleosidase n=1 Tax=Paenibacillus sp. S150 TaxID=2749826 RepID=UPI001C59281B|nr:5'-methylthioadenosine/adenosylhomocysteine nucleosidase [Paenibacillus sp. S150]MBW4083635.1 5'-methylthioadenosine/adenosylhomocysteine nucleosidase [Paenibacillus sp. S150]